MDWRGRRVTVMGLGLFGGGVGAARYLLERGADVLVTDLRQAEELTASRDQLAQYRPRWRLGEHRQEDFVDVDLVVASPAVPQDSPYLLAARAAGTITTTELGLLLDACPARVIGVTGSNGKSTVTCLIGAALSAAGLRCWVGGNLGGSLLDRVSEMKPDDRVVIEYSSFQLEALSGQKRSPWISVVTTLSPNHLDRHGSWTAYVRAKAELLRHQGPEDHAVLNLDDAAVRNAFTREGNGARTWYGLDSTSPPVATGLERGQAIWRTEQGDRSLFDLGRLKLQGRFNVRNAMAAAIAAGLAGAEPESAARGVESFPGLPHRLESVGETNGVVWINDSKSTNPASTIAALESLDRPVVLLVGGRNKGMSLDELAELVPRRARAVVCFGEMADSLKIALGVCPIPLATAPDLDSACRAADSLVRRGDCVLLSPGFASFDEFRSFEHRGDRFRSLVRRRIGASKSTQPVADGGR